ncbi:glycosyltransferase [Candidatus Parcubacteria bacterium]|nr:glycosyltransferase [Candidatus Parcubacteria bacterium]
MKILMLSTDPRVFDIRSAVASRLIAYGELTEGIRVLVSAGGLSEEKEVALSPRVVLGAVSARSRFLRPLALARAGYSLRKEGFSLVTAQDPFETGFAGFILSMLLKIPLEVQVHTDFLSPYFARHSYLNRVRVALASLILPKARSIRVVSLRIKRSILSRYGLAEKKVTVLPIMNPSSVPTEEVHLKERHSDFSSFSLVVSRLEPEKDLRRLLEAFAEVSRTEEKAALVLVGEGGEREALERHARTLGIEKRVLFEGWQSPAAYYKEADLYVLNSLFEGYGLTLIEAAQAGCPILTTDVGIVGEVITEENASVVPPGDIRALARAWQTALENPQYMREKAELAMEAVRRHSPLTPESYAETIVGLWREACARGV